MAKTIALLATLDTKGAEVAYMRDLIVARGHRALVVDYRPDRRTGDDSRTFPTAPVAEAGGKSLDELAPPRRSRRSRRR